MRPYVTRPLAALLAAMLGVTTCAERALHELAGLHAANCAAHVAACDGEHGHSHGQSRCHSHSDTQGEARASEHDAAGCNTKREPRRDCHEHSCPSASGDSRPTAGGEPQDSRRSLKTSDKLQFAAQHDHGDCVVCRYLMSSSLAPTYCKAPSVEWLPNERSIGDDHASPAQFFLSVLIRGPPASAV